MKFNELGRSFFRKMVQIRSNFATTCTIKGTRGAKLPIDATFSGSLEKSLDKVVSRGEKNFSVHKKYMNFLTHRKTALDEHLYKLSAGRSMVEMLGVLAIIGVLSVGAISGYSKAMMKYKLNKQTEQIGSILDYISIHDEQLSSVGYGSFNATQLLIKMGIIPTEMIKPNDDMYIYDVFGNNIRIYHSQSDNGVQYYGLWMNIYQSTHDICLNMYQISKLRSSNLRRAVVSKGDDTLGTIVYGDAYCSQNVQCLKNLTLSEIDELCNFCDDAGTQCRFQILWGYKTAN